MTDEPEVPTGDDEQHPDFIAVPMPAAIARHIASAQAAVEHQQLANVAFRHEVHRMFGELSEPHLLTVKAIFNNIVQQNGSIVAAYLEGVAVEALSSRFGYCAACSVKHDNEAEEALRKWSAEGPEVPPINIAAQPINDPVIDTSALTDDPRLSDFKLAQEYGLSYHESEGPDDPAGWLCDNCGQRYSSPQDRALKPHGVDGCSGCQQKAAWG